MKVNFSKEQVFIPTWNENDGLPKKDQVKVTLKPLKMGDLINLMDALQGLQNSGKDNDVDAIRSMIDSVGHLLPEYCELGNLSHEQGEVNISELCEYPFFFELAAEILTALANMSMPSEDDTKNLSEQPD